MADVTQQTPTTVNLVNPQGRLVGVPSDQVSTALGSGYRQETDQEYNARWQKERYGTGIANELIAAGAGAARGLTFGLSDTLLTKSKLVDPKLLRAYKEANPIASVAGEIGGVAIPALVGGGGTIGVKGKAITGAVKTVGAMPRAAGAIGRAAEEVAASGISSLGLKGVGARALEKGISKAAGGAVEGTLYGGGQLVSEQALGDQDLTAEHVLTHLGMSAVLGGAVGGALGAGGTIAEAGAKKLPSIMGAPLKGATVGEKVANWVDDFSTGERFRAAFGQNKKAFKQLYNKDILDAADEQLRKVVKAGDTQESIVTKLQAKRDELGSKLRETVQKLDDATVGRPMERLSPLQVAARIEKEVLPEIDPVSSPNVLADVQGYVQRLRGTDKSGNRPKDLMSEIARIFKGDDAGIPFSRERMSFSEARKMRSALQDTINYNVDPKPLTAARKQMARIWNDVIDEHAEPILTSLGAKEAGTYKALRREFGVLEEMVGHGEDRTLGNMANRLISPSDYGVGAATGIAMGGVSPLSVAAGAAGAVGHNILRRYGPAVAADYGSRLTAKLGAIKAASNAVSTKISNAVDGFIEASSGISPGRAIIPTVEQAFSRPIAEVSALVAKKRERSQEPKRQAPENYRKRIDEVIEAARHPELSTERVAKAIAGFSDEAPNIATKVAAGASTALQFLAEKAPKDKTPSMLLNPSARKWEPTKAELAKWSRYVDAVDNPMSVLDELKKGTVSHEAVESLRVVYPKMYEGIRAQLAARVSELQKELPYRQRVQLSILFGTPLDPMMQPDVVSWLQSVHSSIAQQAGAAQARPTSGRKSAVTDLATTSERLQAGS